MSEPIDPADAIELGRQRRSQRRRTLVGLAVGLALASAAVAGVARWTSARVRLEGTIALAEAHRAYVTALREGLPPSWSSARVLQAHALAHQLDPDRAPRVAGLREACHAIGRASYDAWGGEPDDGPCEGLDLVWGDCRLERLGGDNEGVRRFDERLAACEADLGRRLEERGEPAVRFGLEGEPLSPPPSPSVLPLPPVALERSGRPLVLPSTRGVVVVEFAYERECGEDDLTCLRHVVHRLTERGWSPPQRIDPLDPVRVWWRVHPLDDGAVLLVGHAPDVMVVARVGPEGGEPSTVSVAHGGLPRSIVPLRGGTALLRSSAGAWLVHPDLRLEPVERTDAEPEGRALAFAGPSGPSAPPWSPEAVADVGGGVQLHLRRKGELLVAERREPGATVTALPDRVVVLEGDGDCEAWANEHGRVVLSCEDAGTLGVLVSEDGGVTWGHDG